MTQHLKLTARFRHRLRSACERIAAHRLALPALAGISFLGGSVAPLPSDIMLIPMIVARPHQWKFLTAVTVISSVTGALFAYAIGIWLVADMVNWINPELLSEIDRANATLSTWGALALFAAALLPIPFKILAVSYGAAHLSLTAFFLAVTLGRSLRFYMMGVVLLKLSAKVNQTRSEQGKGTPHE